MKIAKRKLAARVALVVLLNLIAFFFFVSSHLEGVDVAALTDAEDREILISAIVATVFTVELGLLFIWLLWESA